MESSISGCQAVERAIAILELFDEHRTVLAIGDVARALGVHRSTASRLMATLERRGLLEQAEGAAGYRLGLGLVPLAGYVLNRFPVRARAGQVLRELRDATGETAWLGVLDGHRITYLDQASSPYVTVNVDWVGVRQTLTEGVTGRLLLAYQQPAVIERLVAEAQPGAIGLSETELAAVRRLGYAVRMGDGEDGYMGVAVPIRDGMGTVVAAISLGGPRFRVSEERLREELVPAALHAAARVSEALGHRAA
jgi:DNA-binding IclR family transcriptional regulator